MSREYSAQQPLFSERTWRDPWEQINQQLNEPLIALGYGHVYHDGDTMRFATLGRRVLAALEELRNLRQCSNSATGAPVSSGGSECE